MGKDQEIVHWDTGIKAKWYRANELIEISEEDPVLVHLVEEDTEQHFKIYFEDWRVVKTIPEETSWGGDFMPDIPEDGNQGFFKVTNSNLIKKLEKQHSVSLDGYKHYVICTYDDLIEIVAKGAWVDKLEEVGYPEGHGRIQLDVDESDKASPPKGNDVLSKMMRARMKSFED
jgi:hypothetical protein